MQALGPSDSLQFLENLGRGADLQDRLTKFPSGLSAATASPERLPSRLVSLISQDTSAGRSPAAFSAPTQPTHANRKKWNHPLFVRPSPRRRTETRPRCRRGTACRARIRPGRNALRPFPPHPHNPHNPRAETTHPTHVPQPPPHHPKTSASGAANLAQPVRMGTQNAITPRAP